MNQKIKRFSVVMASCMLWLVSFAQQTVTGHVQDGQGEPLIGVSADYLARKRAEGKHYNVALSHAVKKLVRLIFALQRSGRNYAPVP